MDRLPGQCKRRERSIRLKRIKTKWVVAAIVILVLLALFALVGFFTDWLWFKELGYVSVFFTELLTQLKFGVPSFILITVISYFYLLAMKRAYYKKLGACDMERPEKQINRAALGLSAVFGLLTAFSIASRLWFQILQFINSTDFGIADPIFGHDVSFYIFKLDFISRVNSILIWIILGFAVMNVIYYLLLLNLRKPQFLYEVENERAEREPRQQQRPNPFEGMGGMGGLFGQMFGMGGPNQGPFGQGAPEGFPHQPRPSHLNRDTMGRLLGIAGLQLKVLGVLFFLMVALHFFLQQFTLLYSGSSGVVYGAGYTDINIMLWVYRLMILLSLVGAVMFILGMNRRKLRTVLLVPAVMVGVGILGGVATVGVQNLIVSPDEINKEYPYLENNIQFTRYAYDLQDIDIADYDIKYNLTIADIQNNLETISNIRINDYEPALKFYNQTQAIRLYYRFNDVDVDRYMVNGEYTQTFLSAREIDETTTTDQWLSNHLIYTHGYGITLSRVDKVTASGQPDMLIDSIPPVSDVAEIEVTNPAIYFGELTNNYIIVNTDEQEFDYPSGESNVYTEYEGNAGIPLTLLNRTLFALRESSIKLLVSSNINSDSRILINRNIAERVQKIAPFLYFDDDPYIVVADGNLYWMLDAYTVSGYYPYSEPFDNSNINYIRNSVKVVVDAYDGDTNFYIVDPEDPVACTLQKIYPKLFQDFEQMPESLQVHIRYPNAMFNIQANVYAKYHMTDVNVFYQNEDRWNIATEVYGTETITMTPNYYIMKLPGADTAEFINSIPYTPSGKQNMTALLVARNDGAHYGELKLYQLPKDRLIYGPQQVESQINQHTEIAQDFTLWSSAGSTYTRGNMFVIPIEDSLMYVEPIYLESASSSLPEVKRVIIYYHERIAYEETLAEALDAMFGEGASALLTGGAAGDVEEETDGEPTGELSFSEIAALANEAFNNATQAQQNGDWAAYGRYLEQLAEYLALLAPEEETPEPVDELPAEEAPVTENGAAEETPVTENGAAEGVVTQ